MVAPTTEVIKKITPAAVQEVSRASSFSLLLSPFRVIGNAISSVFSAFTSMYTMIAIFIAGWLANKSWMPKQAAGILGKTTEVVNLPYVATAEFSGAIGAALGKASPVSKAVEKVSNHVGAHANRMLGRHSLGARALERAGQNNVMHNVFTGLAVLQETGSIFRSFGGGFSELRQMQKDITGKPASIWSVLFGVNLHPLVKEARKDVVGIRALLGTGFRVAGIAGNLWLAFLSRTPVPSGGKGLMAYMLKTTAIAEGSGLAAKLVMSGNTAIDASINMRRDPAAQISMEDRLALVGGLAKNMGYKAIEAVAAQFHQENLSRAEMLQRLAEGQTAAPQNNPPVTVNGKTYTSNKRDGKLADAFSPTSRSVTENARV